MSASIPHPLSSHLSLVKTLERLHAASLAQEGKGVAVRHSHFPKSKIDDILFEEQLVALDEDKCRDMYLILRGMGATRVVEAGTSYGVSLLWLLAAVSDNISIGARRTEHPALVIGTELSPSKASLAHSHVLSAFGRTPSFLSLLEGDLLEQLPAAAIQDASIDALLLDIWAPLALPTLKILLPKFRQGAAVFIDNTTVSADRYKDLLSFLREPSNGFLCSTMPHDGGFDLCIYVGHATESQSQ